MDRTGAATCLQKIDDRPHQKSIPRLVAPSMDKLRYHPIELSPNLRPHPSFDGIRQAIPF